MNDYYLEFALDTLPNYMIIGNIYEIKICVIHISTKGIGRKKSTPIRINIFHDQDGIHRGKELLYELRGGNEIPPEGIATIQLKFLPQQFFGNIVIMANGEDIQPTQAHKIKLARFQLHIHNFHKDTFFKDSFGKYSYIKTIVYLLGSQNRIIQDVMVPLQVSLRYEGTLEEVPNTTEKPTLNLFDLHHRIEKGCSLIPFRIEVVSSSHNNRNFVFCVEPERNGRHNDGSILPCVSTPIEVKARLRPFNPERTPPKYNPNRYHQEQDMIRESVRQMLNNGNLDIHEMIGNELSKTKQSTTATTTTINDNNNNTTPNQKKSNSSSRTSPNSNDLDINLGGMSLSDPNARLQTVSPSPSTSSTSSILSNSSLTSVSSSSQKVKTSSSNNSLSTSRGIPNSPNSPLVKIESSNTQSARSVFRGDSSSSSSFAPSTPINNLKIKSEPNSNQNNQYFNDNSYDDDGGDDEDWVINFKKNSLVISGLELDRWEERVLGNSRTSNNSSNDNFIDESNLKKISSSPSPVHVPVPTPISLSSSLSPSSSKSKLSTNNVSTTRQTRSSTGNNK